MPEPKFHLIAGSTGAGKSTYSKSLCSKIGGLYFGIDGWMSTLFWPDSPDPISFDWAIERVRRCEVQALEVAVQAASLGVPCVLDLGFTKADARLATADSIRQSGFDVQLHVLDVPRDVRWGRVEQRNRLKGDTFSFEVDQAMFDFVETMWEVPTSDEMTALNGIWVSDS